MKISHNNLNQYLINKPVNSYPSELKFYQDRHKYNIFNTVFSFTSGVADSKVDTVLQFYHFKHILEESLKTNIIQDLKECNVNICVALVTECIQSFPLISKKIRYGFNSGYLQLDLDYLF